MVIVKKSAMIRKLQRFLEKEGITDDTSAASLILDMVLEAGMLPPPTHVPYKKGGSCLCGHFESCEYCTTIGVERNEWDKE
jgi:hypothetical protein